MGHLITPVSELELDAPDEYSDLQRWLHQQFLLIRNRMLAPSIVLETYDAEPARGSETNLHGGLIQLNSAAVLNTASPIVSDLGLSKLFILPTAGADLVGDILITGIKVDRNTGVQTPGFVETLFIDRANPGSNDSITDANGNVVHRLTDGHLTENWFLGTVTFSTVAPADVSLTCDIYSISFEQFNDIEFAQVDTFDVNLFVTDVAARFDGYLFSVVFEPATNFCTILDEAALNLGVPPNASVYYRLRKHALDIRLDAAVDGIFLHLHYSIPSRIEDVNVKIWVNDPRGV
jgi:hypothetical protein